MSLNVLLSITGCTDLAEAGGTSSRVLRDFLTLILIHLTFSRRRWFCESSLTSRGLLRTLQHNKMRRGLMPDLYKELDYILGYLYEAHGLAANNQYKLTEGDWLSEISGGIDLLIEAMNGIMTTRTAIYGFCNSFRFPGYIRKFLYCRYCCCKTILQFNHDYGKAVDEYAHVNRFPRVIHRNVSLEY